MNTNPKEDDKKKGDRRQRALESLHQLGLEIAGQLDSSELSRLIIRHAMRLLDAKGGVLALYDRDHNHLKIIEGLGAEAAFIGKVVNPHEGLTGQVFAEKSSRFINDYKNWDNRLEDFVSDRVNSYLVVPLLWRSDVLGVLGVSRSLEGKNFDDEDIWLMELYGAQAAIALVNARFYGESKRRERLSEVSQEVAVELLSMQNIDQTLKVISQVVIAQTGAEAIYTHLHDQSSERELLAMCMQQSGRVHLVSITLDPESLTSAVIERGERLISAEQGSPLRRDMDKVYDIDSEVLVGVPLIRDQEVVGVFNISYSETPDENTLNFLNVLAAQTVVTVTNMQINLVIRDTAVAMNSTLRLDKVLKLLLENVARVVPHTASNVMMIEDGIARVVHTQGYTPKQKKTLEQSQFDVATLPTFRQMVGQGVATIVSDVQRVPGWVMVPGMEWLNSYLGVPVKVDGEVIGVLSLDSREKDFFKAGHADRLITFANQAAIAIQNARLYEASQLRAQEFNALNLVAVELLSSENLKGTLQVIAEEILYRTKAHDIHIHLYDAEADTLSFGLTMLTPNIVDQRALLPRSDGLTYLTARSGERSIVTNPEKHPLYKEELYRWERRFETLVSLPMKNSERVVGVVNIFFKQSVGKQTLNFLYLLANQAAVAIQNADLHEREKRASIRSEALLKATQALSLTLNLDEVFELIFSQCKEVLPYETASILIYEDTSLARVALAGYEEKYVADQMRKEGEKSLILKEIQDKKKSIIIDDVRKDSRWIPLKEGKNIRCWMGIPLIAQDRLKGILTLSNTETGAFGEEDLILARAFASHAAVAIRNSQLYEQTRKAQERFEDIALSTSDWIWEANADGTLVYCSSQVVDALGYEAEELVGQGVFSLMNSDELIRLMRHAVLTIKDAEKQFLLNFESVFTHKEGHEVLLQLTGAPLYGKENTIIGYRGAARDITMKREAEQRERVAFELGQRLITMLSQEELVKMVVEQLHESFGYSLIELYLYDAESERLILKAGTPEALKLNPIGHEVPLNFESSSLTRAANTRKRVIVHDLPSSKTETANQHRRIRSEIACPLVGGEKLLGVLRAQSPDVNRFLESEALTLQNLMAQISIALVNARLYEAESVAKMQASTLLQVAHVLSSTLGLKEVFALILSECQQVLPYTTGSVLIYKEGKLSVMARTGQGDISDAMFEEIVSKSKLVQKISKTLQPIVISDVRKSPKWVPDPRFVEAMSWLGVPLVVRGTLLGVLMLDSDQPGAYKEEHLDIIQAVANHAAIAVDNANLFWALEQQTEHLEELVHERTGEIIRERERMMTIVDNAAEGIFFTTPQGIIEYANPYWEVITGLSVDDVLGWQMTDVLLEKTDAQALQTEINTTIMRRETWENDFYAQRPDGSIYVAGISITPVLDPKGDIIHLVGMMRDVTAQKEMEGMRRKFVANVSHELRTPITNIKLYSTLLRTGSEEKRDLYIDTLIEQLGRLEKLVETLLDLSQLDREQAQINREMVDLNILVDEVIRAYHLQAEDRGLSLHIDLASSLPKIYAERERIMQILTNLLINAINYTAEGDQLGVKTWQEETEDGKWVILSVWDKGVGIAPEDLPFIFNRFFRAKMAKVTKVPGTGLGLSIVKEIVELHGGTISAKSKLKEGTTFTIRFPVSRKIVDETPSEGATKS